MTIRTSYPIVYTSEISLTFSSFFTQVSEELIRVAILWHEMWHEGLEEASRLYFGERNVKGMFAVLEPLHAMMERGPQTLKETSFNQVCDFSEWCWIQGLPLFTAAPQTRASACLLITALIKSCTNVCCFVCKSMPQMKLWLFDLLSWHLAETEIQIH